MAPANKTGVYARKLLEGVPRDPAGDVDVLKIQFPMLFFSGTARRHRRRCRLVSPRALTLSIILSFAIQAKQEAERELAETKPERDKI